jgi:hypothetical protein
VNEAETNLEMEPSPDAPQRALIAARTASGTLQVHQAPLCAASGSKLKGMMSVALRRQAFGICSCATLSFRSYQRPRTPDLLEPTHTQLAAMRPLASAACFRERRTHDE